MLQLSLKVQGAEFLNNYYLHMVHYSDYSLFFGLAFLSPDLLSNSLAKRFQLAVDEILRLLPLWNFQFTCAAGGF